MRDTAIDIGKWINGGYNKGKSSIVANKEVTTTVSEPNHSQTKYDAPFLEQRMKRNFNREGTLT